ncbi:MAG: O-antigen ligase family protein [Parcubacteria group bacterium]
MRKPSLLNIVFVFEVLLFVLIILGIVPRSFALYLLVILAVYTITAPIEDGIVLFIRSIPLFIALPLTETFDSLNTWRIISAILFIKWGLIRVNPFEWIKTRIKNLTRFHSDNILLALVLLLLLALVSVLVAIDAMAAIKRVIYFVNLSLIGIVIYDLIGKIPDLKERLIKNIAIPVVIVTLAGLLQLLSTYLVDIYGFVDIWGWGIQCRQFGQQWCTIAVETGNTWFAYYGPQLSLRVFSLFPDTHSFPIFLLLGLPALFAIALKNIDFTNFKTAIRTRAKMHILWIPLIMFIMILTGTRGIWAAVIGTVLVLGIFMAFFRQRLIQDKKNIIKYISVFFVIFMLLFVITQPIFTSDQFQLSKDDDALLRNRLRSVFNWAEMSNAARIKIWKTTIKSIADKPLRGVGIANFPVVLNQDIALSKAGSSAHNLYLHIAAEMGITALLVSLWFIWILLRREYSQFINSKNRIIQIYSGAGLIFIVWVLGYSMTDFALFDERAFLLFVITVALITSYRVSTDRNN